MEYLKVHVVKLPHNVVQAKKACGWKRESNNHFAWLNSCGFKCHHKDEVSYSI